MAIEVWLGGEYLPPDSVRDWIMGEGSYGYTTFWQLGTWLRARGMLTEYRDTGALVESVEEAVGRGDAVLALFYWQLAQPWSGHFMAVTGYTTDGGIILHDPWDGTRRTMDGATWRAWYKGELMIVGRP